jgi:DnaJ domain
VEKTPFSVLDLPPDAGVDTARSRYRELAREHHPDTAPGADKDDATRIMAELNWAMEELERHADRWRAHIGSPIELIEPDAVARKPVSVTPTLVLLNGENGFVAYVTAAAPDVDASALRLRYVSDVIDVERLPSFGGVANFRISVAEDVRELATPMRERVEIRAPGCKPVEVSVAIEAFSTPSAGEPSAGWRAALAAAARFLRAA